MSTANIDDTLKKLVEALLQIPTKITPATPAQPSQGINLQSFDENNETFDSYLQRVENYLDLRGKCFKCGQTSHKANTCPHKNLKCHKCKKSGHVQEVCFGDKIAENRAIGISTYDYDNDETDSDALEDINTIQIVQVNNIHNEKFMINVNIEDAQCLMEVDTGAAVSTMSLQCQEKLLPDIRLKPTSLQLRTYTGEIIHPVGKAKVNVSHKSTVVQCDLYVINAKVDAILGREWFRKLELNILDLKSLVSEMNESQCKNEIDKILNDYNDIFVETTGKIPNYKCKLELQENMTPKFIRHRPVPYALKDRIENELSRLENNGTIEKVEFSQWGTPIVPVVKKNGDIRLCADYKITINKAIKDDSYPIPTVDDIFAKMSGGKYFMTLDLHQAYLHMEVDENTSILQAISTHKGTYKVKRLMFGVKAAPKIWQRFMDSILQDIDGVSCFFDDIKLQGSTYEELLVRFKQVLQRLRSHGLHLNKTKCQFLLDHITYLGHYIDKLGIKPMNDKIQSIQNCARPTNVSEARTFLGLVNYYQKFLPKLACRLQPIYNLLKKDVKFYWSTECEEIFKQIKNEITSTKVLIPFDNKLPLFLATDASPNGLGAVISHIDEHQNERPIAFASRTLTNSEKNYSQIDKEATAIIWGLKKFFQYCYGRKIILITDNKPLTRIFHPNKDLPSMSAVRLLHYANFLSGFDYEIRYRNTKDHSNADFLSRFPTEEPKDELSKDETTIFQLNQIETMPVTQKEIQREILKDSECKQYYNALQRGGQLPNGEPEVKETPHHWEYPTTPWQRVHIDYAGPFMNCYILIVVDAHTKWVEAIPTQTISSSRTIKILREIFARFGLPLTLVSDNGTNFSSREFQDFTKSNGIRHIFCAPYHPSSNGQAERYVSTVKEGLRAMSNEDGDLNLKLCRFLMQYRKIPNATTGVSPAELMFKRTIRTRIDLVKTDVTSRVSDKQSDFSYKEPREFADGESIQARFYNNKCCKWKFGRIIRKIGSRMYEILIDDEKHTRHVDQLRRTDCRTTNDKNNYNSNPLIEISNKNTTTNENDTRHDNNVQQTNTSESVPNQPAVIHASPESSLTPASTIPTPAPTTSSPAITYTPPEVSTSPKPKSSSQPIAHQPSAPASPRRSKRTRRAPNRLDL
ncbi:uncharacterized protein K02A2.6-like [Eupeodes corollae]|uniref:uncharacterized protein K02A2.6-like n=1 Tax=Eupeodes corollae TaxID=290404 RepID=UPI002490BEDD|nr:uncharacterized protein K02A2.6-like [Eupeodes corollae]